MTPTPNRQDRRSAAPVVDHPPDLDGALAPRVAAAHAERLAPFVAWMATQELEEALRREHREAVEAYLMWCHSDQGPRHGRRHRYEAHLRRSSPQRLAAARAGLDRYTQYREIVALTLPIDH